MAEIIPIQNPSMLKIQSLLTAALLLFSFICHAENVVNPDPQKHSEASGDSTLARYVLSSGKGKPGDRVCSEMRVWNFRKVESFQLIIKYDASVILPVCPPDLSGSALGPLISPGYFNCHTAGNGRFHAVWFYDPVTLPDSSLLFRACFDLVGKPGERSIITTLDKEDNYSEICHSLNINSTYCGMFQGTPGEIEIVHDSLNIDYYVCDTDAAYENGSLVFRALGGTPPYRFEVNEGLYSGMLTDNLTHFKIDALKAGIYNLKITDSANMSVEIKEIHIKKNAGLKVASKKIKPATCSNRCNGMIEISELSNAIPPVRYKWSDYFYEVRDTGKIDFLCNGLYTVSITDQSGCMIIDTSILWIDTLKVNITPLAFSPCDSIRKIKVLITGGSPPHRYARQFGPLINIPADSIISFDPEKFQFITISDQLFCNTRINTDTIQFEGDDYPLKAARELQNFFKKTGGQNWKNENKWPVNPLTANCNPCDGWYGITCENNKIVSIELPENNLNGTLTEMPVIFPYLRKLDLSENRLRGCIPAGYLKLCENTDVYLNNNNAMPWYGNFIRFCEEEGIQLNAPCKILQNQDGVISDDCLCKNTSAVNEAHEERPVIINYDSYRSIVIQGIREKFRFTLFAPDGRIFQTQIVVPVSEQSELKIPDLTPGIYFIKIDFQNESMVRKCFIY